MISIVIYGLLEPFSEEVRYVGKTKDLQGRIRDHLHYDKSDTYKARWINKLQEQGLDPFVKVLEEVAASTPWQEREKFWIKKLKSEGHRLTNASDGGDGGGAYGRKWTEEQRKKFSIQKAGVKQSDFHKEQNRKFWRSPEGQKLRVEITIKRSLTMKGRSWSTAQRAAYEKSKAEGKWYTKNRTTEISRRSSSENFKRARAKGLLDWTPERIAKKTASCKLTWASKPPEEKRLTDARRAQISAQNRTRKLTEEQKRNIGLGVRLAWAKFREQGKIRRGVSFDEKTRQKMSASAKKWRAERRETRELERGLSALQLP